MDNTELLLFELGLLMEKLKGLIFNLNNLNNKE